MDGAVKLKSFKSSLGDKKFETSKHRKVLEEACSKHGLNPEEFDICHHKKPLDLSLPIRFTNLPNNALLELNSIRNIRVESKVTVALQLESGERILKEFSPSSSLQEVIAQCLSSRSDEPMQVEGLGDPVCIYMRQKLMGEALKNTNLRSLGLTKGKAIFRLLYRQGENFIQQAHVSAPLKKNASSILSDSDQQPMLSLRTEHLNQVHLEAKKTENLVEPKINVPKIQIPKIIDNSEVSGPKAFDQQPVPALSTDNLNRESQKEESVVKPDVNSPGNEIPGVVSEREHDGSNRWTTENTKQMPVTKVDSMQINETEQEMNVDVKEEEIEKIIYIGDRHAVLYNLDDISDTKKADLPDDFFDLTVGDVRFLMDDYRRERMEMENKPLMIGAQRRLLHHLCHYSKTILRIYFPERLVLQAVFSVQETVQSVIGFIKNFVEEKNLNFYLYTTPPKEKLVAGKTLLEVALIPAANVYLGCEAPRPAYLSPELRCKTSDPKAAALAASIARKGSFCEAPSALTTTIEDNPVSTEPQLPLNTTQELKNEIRTTSGKVPKWLKLSK